MRELLLKVWTLPWPPGIRRVLEYLSTRNWLQRLVIAQFKVGVVGVITNERGEILLFRHTYRTRHPWGLPTGFLEHGEQPEAALQREMYEEAGLDVTVRGVWKVLHDTRRHLISIVFRGDASGEGFVQSAEVAEVRFFRFDQLPRLLPDQWRLIVAAREEAHGERVAGGRP